MCLIANTLLWLKSIRLIVELKFGFELNLFTKQTNTDKHFFEWVHINYKQFSLFTTLIWGWMRWDGVKIVYNRWANPIPASHFLLNEKKKNNNLTQSIVDRWQRYLAIIILISNALFFFLIFYPKKIKIKILIPHPKNQTKPNPSY